MHFLPFPAVRGALLDKVAQRQGSVMRMAISLGQVLTERCKISLTTGLSALSYQHLKNHILLAM